MTNYQLNILSMKFDIILTNGITWYPITNVVFSALTAEGSRIVKTVSNSMAVMSWYCTFVYIYRIIGTSINFEEFLCFRVYQWSSWSISFNKQKIAASNLPVHFQREREAMPDSVPKHVNISHLHKLYHFLHTLLCMYNEKIQQCCYKQPTRRSCAHLWYSRRYLSERRKQLG